MSDEITLEEIKLVLAPRAALHTTDIHATGTMKVKEVISTTFEGQYGLFDDRIESRFIKLNANPAVTDGTADIFIACTRKKGTETELVFRVKTDGEMFFKHNFGDVTQHAKLASSIVTADSSVYVGSCRLSYDRAAHLLEMRRLKLNHVPLYLQGRGFTAADLPSTHVQTT